MHQCDTMFVKWLGQNNKIMSMFVLFSLHFLVILKVWLFFKNGGTNVTHYTKVVNQDSFSQFFKSTTKVFFSKSPVILTEK